MSQVKLLEFEVTQIETLVLRKYVMAADYENAEIIAEKYDPENQWQEISSISSYEAEEAQ